jgi:hypothetical protein
MSIFKKTKGLLSDFSGTVGKQTKSAGSSIKDRYKKVSDSLTGVSLPFLSSPELLNWSENITKGTATIYDKSLDMVYLKTHIGGGNHRMFDDSHDLFSAWDKVKIAKTDDSSTEEIIAYVSAIWKDLTTKQGLPIFTWEKGNYDQFASWFSEHIPFIDKSYFYDLMSFDVFEIIGASVGIATFFFGLNKNDEKKIAEVIGSMGVTSIASANPIMAIALVFITAYVVFIKKKEIDKEALTRGVLISTISVAIFSFLGFPLLIELGIAILITTLVKKKVLENEEIMFVIKERLYKIKESSLSQFSNVLSNINFSFKEIGESKFTSQLSVVKNQSIKFVYDGIVGLPQQTKNLISGKQDNDDGDEL